MKIIQGPVLDKNPVKRAAIGAVLRFLWRFIGPRGVRKLRARIELDQAQGITAAAGAVKIDVQAVRSSIEAALLQNQESQADDDGTRDRIKS